MIGSVANWRQAAEADDRDWWSMRPTHEAHAASVGFFQITFNAVRRQSGCLIQLKSDIVIGSDCKSGINEFVHGPQVFWSRERGLSDGRARIGS